VEAEGATRRDEDKGKREGDGARAEGTGEEEGEEEGRVEEGREAVASVSSPFWMKKRKERKTLSAASGPVREKARRGGGREGGREGGQAVSLDLPPSRRGWRRGRRNRFQRSSATAAASCGH
jgi:hypothetical protein